MNPISKLAEQACTVCRELVTIAYHCQYVHRNSMDRQRE